MSRFDPNKITKNPEDWSVIAHSNVAKDNTQWWVIAGIVGGAVVSSAVTLPAGLVVASWAFYNATKIAKNNKRNQEAVISYGCVAHILDGRDFYSYLKQVGPEAVQRELDFAIEQELVMSNSAYDYLENLTTPSQLDQGNNKVLTGIPTSTQNNTYLPEPNYSSTPIVSNTQVVDNKPQIDLIKEITSPIRNCIVFGIGGSGKGMLVANGIRQIKRDNPNRKIFYIDPKNEPGESGYTDGYCDVIRRKTCFGESPEAICQWMDEVLDEYTKWANQQDESLLIIDEGTILGDAAAKEKNKRIGTIILHISSLGGASKINVWLMAQAPFVKSLGLDLTASSQVAAITIISEHNIGVMTQWKQSKIIQSIDEKQLKSLINASPVGRAVYFGATDQWYPMPRLENYSKIDRDNNQPVGDSLSPSDRQSLRTATATLQSPTQLLIEKLNNFTGTIDDFIIKEMNEIPNQKSKEVIKEVLKNAGRQDLINRFDI